MVSTPANRRPGASASVRVVFVTIGQAPRDDVVPEMLSLSGVAPGEVEHHQAGALDGATPEEIAANRPAAREGTLYTRLANGDHVVVGSGFVARRLEPLLHRLDSAGYDLIALITTGVFQTFALRTPFVHGQQVVDAWIAALVMGDCELGLVYPQPRQHRAFAHGTLIQNARAVVATGDAERLDQAAAHMAGAELILMHSVGYTEAMARQMATLTRKPVVTARRIIAGAIRLHLGNSAVRGAAAAKSEGPVALLDRLPDTQDRLTPRERDVLAAVLDGKGNKAIGRLLGISHRTVEIHRARRISSVGELASSFASARALIAGDA
jgi:protein AroM